MSRRGCICRRDIVPSNSFFFFFSYVLTRWYPTGREEKSIEVEIDVLSHSALNRIIRNINRASSFFPINTHSSWRIEQSQCREYLAGDKCHRTLLDTYFTEIVVSFFSFLLEPQLCARLAHGVCVKKIYYASPSGSIPLRSVGQHSRPSVKCHVAHNERVVI